MLELDELDVEGGITADDEEDGEPLVIEGLLDCMAVLEEDEELLEELGFDKAM